MNKTYDYVMQEPTEKTINMLYTNENELVLMSEHESTSGCRFEGRQDIRLYQDGNTVMYTASVSDCNGRICIEKGVYNIGTHSLESPIVISSPCDNPCEKNWCMYNDKDGSVKCIYSWHPLVVGRIDGNQFVEESRVDIPELRRFRGSSHGVLYEDEIWFVTHIVSYEKPRRYYHSVVVLDCLTTKALRVAHPFTFEGQPIEYCCGILVNKDTISFYYSVRDASPSVICVSKSTMLWKSLGGTALNISNQILPSK